MRRSHSVLLGGVILLLAVIAAVVVPRVFDPPTVDGAAEVEPPPPPPSVGACWRDPLPRDPETTADPVTVPCTEAHAGEVMLVESDRSDPDARLELVDRCASAEVLDPYLSWPASELPGWQPSLALGTVVAGPSEAQQRSGQQWLACVAVAADGTERTDEALAGAFEAVGPAGAFGLCWPVNAAGVPNSGSVPCDAPHLSESFASRTLTPTDVGLTQQQLDADCRRIADRATGRTGFPDDPALLLTAAAFASVDGTVTGAATLPIEAGATGFVRCVVSPADGVRELSGSVRQIGDGPLPWVG